MIANPPTLTLRLRPQDTSTRRARVEVRDFCTRHGLDDMAADAELLTSELVRNAIVTAAWCVTLRVATTPGGLRVTVADDAAEPIVAGFQLP